MEDLCSWPQLEGTPASASERKDGSGTPCSRRLPRKSDPSPGLSSGSQPSGSGNRVTKSRRGRSELSRSAFLEAEVEERGLRRIADSGDAYLYVISDDAGRAKIGITGDIAARVRQFWAEGVLVRRLHGVIAMRRDLALAAERRAKEISPCLRSSWRRIPTDWFELEPASAWNVAVRAANDACGDAHEPRPLAPPLLIEAGPDWAPAKGSEGKARYERIGLRLPVGMQARIKEAARDDARNMSNWIEKAIRDALERSEAKRES